MVYEAEGIVFISKETPGFLSPPWLAQPSEPLVPSEQVSRVASGITWNLRKHFESEVWQRFRWNTPNNIHEIEKRTVEPLVAIAQAKSDPVVAPDGSAVFPCL